MSAPPELVWQCRDRRLVIGRRPLVLGIVNVTPDSFSDGGQHADPATAMEHGLKLVAEGADLLDVGGESTRPGSQPIPADEQLRRVLPVVRELAAHCGVPISVDTTLASVAGPCLDAGAAVINDVTGLRGDPDMPALAARTGAGVIVMHMQGTPATMQIAPKYDEVVTEVGDFFDERIASLTAAGVAREAIALDPGIGFGKTVAQNLELVRRLDVLLALGRPVLIGLSRKSTLGRVLGDPDAKTGTAAASVGAAVAAFERGASIFRVHDVREHVEALTAAAAVSA